MLFIYSKNMILIIKEVVGFYICLLSEKVKTGKMSFKVFFKLIVLSISYDF